MTDQITMVDYYPKKHRLDFIAPDGLLGGGIVGDRAHVRAAELLMSGNAIVRVCGINSRINKRLTSRKKVKY